MGFPVKVIFTKGDCHCPEPPGMQDAVTPEPTLPEAGEEPGPKKKTSDTLPPEQPETGTISE
jgi:hypothetical protein